MVCLCSYAYIQITEEVSKSLVAMKEILYGTNEKEPQTEAVAQLAQELYNSGLLSTLIADLRLIDFEVRLKAFSNMKCGECPHIWITQKKFCSQTRSQQHRNLHSSQVMAGVWVQHAGGRTWCINSTAQITWFCFQHISTGDCPFYKKLSNLILSLSHATNVINTPTDSAALLDSFGHYQMILPGGVCPL